MRSGIGLGAWVGRILAGLFSAMTLAVLVAGLFRTDGTAAIGLVMFMASLTCNFVAYIEPYKRQVGAREEVRPDLRTVA